jgi:hypothetical protein
LFQLKTFVRTTILLLILFIPVILVPSITQAQNLNTEKFQYLSPVPGSRLNSTGTSIIIKPGDTFDNLNLHNSLTVTGNIGGEYKGKIILAENSRTLIFKPYRKFAEGEIVTVELNNNLKTISGNPVPGLHYSFETSRIDLNKRIKSDPEKYFDFFNVSLEVHNKRVSNITGSLNSPQKFYTVQKDSLPKDFPEIIVDSINNPAPGYIFLTPFGYPRPIPSTYLIIIDNFGIPIFYRRTGAERTLDFKKQANGMLTYYQDGKYYVLDNSYNIIDSLTMQNGYTTDLHECAALKNGHFLMMCYDRQYVAMDTVVEGGNPNALVTGVVFQELDENKNVVFQWRSWDHYQITDATYDVVLTGATVDYVHGNAIEKDYDGNFLLSNRHLDEITKIDSATGKIIWRLGGKYCENNQFTFINDPIGFSHQHDIRRLPNRNITIFDNGNLHSPPFSRAVEYSLDETNKTATLVQEYRNNPETYSVAMGSARKLDNQNLIVGWGLNNTPPAISEVTPDGLVTMHLSIPDTMVNYRAFKFPWKTNLFVTSPDSLLFGTVTVGDYIVQPLNIINNSDREIEINGLINRDSSYIVITTLPITIPPYGNSPIKVVFKPDKPGDHFDDLHLQWNKLNERIVQVVPVIGKGEPVIPVELTSFTASLTNESVILEWSTVTENNNRGFEIERKKQIEWESIGFVDGRGTNTKPNTYTFTDDEIKVGIYSYRLKQIDFNGSFNYSGVINVNVNTPFKFSLNQNYPNPFNPTTKINFIIPEEGKVSLKVYNILGHLVNTLIDKKMTAGSYSINFSAENLPSGIYVYTLSANNYFDSQKMMLLK